MKKLICIPEHKRELDLETSLPKMKTPKTPPNSTIQALQACFCVFDPQVFYYVTKPDLSEKLKRS